VKNYIKYIFFGVIITLLAGVSILEIKNESENVIEYLPVMNKTIILDAGHGGIDPGSLTDDESIKEKDINLLITLKLKELLESSGALVFLTREEDVSLYEEQEGKTIREKYNENLRNRKQMIKDVNADMFISIHLNKFQEAKYYGAQTFYPSGSEESKQIANYIQKELKRVVDDTNNREIKGTQDIYLLKENEIPSVLIECGFLSNPEEAQLLTDEKHQDKIAWGIYVGMQQYFSVSENKK
jgi:N-acetylmuramoyl-L-alanine amidase